MRYEILEKGGTAIVKLFGRLDVTSSPELEIAIKPLAEKDDNVVLDCSALDYASSAGLRVFFRMHKRMRDKGRLIIQNPNENVSEVFYITGLDDVLNIEERTKNRFKTM